MQRTLTRADIATIRSTMDTVADNGIEQSLGLMLPALEAAEMNLSGQLDDLSRDTALGFNEVHNKIDYLRSEINEIKQVLNSLFH